MGPVKPDMGSTKVIRDNGFYPTPPWMIESVLPIVIQGLQSDALVLDPAAGEGNLLAAVRRELPEARIRGIEIDDGRWMECWKRLCTVHNHSSVECGDAMRIDWGHPDLVVMNPPFPSTMAFLRMALSRTDRVLMLQRIGFICPEDRAMDRRGILADHPCDILVHGRRPSYHGTRSRADHVWFWFHPGATRRWRMIG